jgi:hypothetical protein
LGHIVTAIHNKAEPEHMKAILQASAPRSKKDLRVFFGVYGWLQEYVPDFTNTALPLIALLAQRGAWKWTSAEQSAFEAIKRKYYLQTDAANTGMGAVLYQLDDEGARSMISYASAKFSPQRLSITPMSRNTSR